MYFVTSYTFPWIAIHASYGSMLCNLLESPRFRGRAAKAVHILRPLRQPHPVHLTEPWGEANFLRFSAAIGAFPSAFASTFILTLAIQVAERGASTPAPVPARLRHVACVCSFVCSFVRLLVS